MTHLNKVAQIPCVCLSHLLKATQKQIKGMLKDIQKKWLKKTLRP